jgi:hypothetical protein
MRGKESLRVGTAAINVNSEDHYTCFGRNAYVYMFNFRSECLCIYDWARLPMWIKARGPGFVMLITLEWCCALRIVPK